MALLVWLPLRGDLRNLGLSNITVTNNGATVSDEGKIGKCYYFNGTSQYLQFSDSLTTLYEGDFSWALWVKPTDDTRGILISEWSSTGSSNVALELLANRQIRVYWNASPDWSTGKTVPINTWSHIAVTKKSDTIKVYINGSLVAERVYNYAPRSSSSKIRIGDDYRGNTGSTVSYMGYINDVRIYDHCLSPKEIEEISKGLVLHYKLDGRIENGYGNLVVNGSGEFGTTNWEYPSYISDDVPSGSGALLSFTNNNQTIDFIPYSPSVVYTFESYVKSTSTTGTSYPALIPYDIDKYRINNPNTRSGFNLGTMTTITLTLNPGDTKIYVLSLSSWNANSGHYYNYAAIFGYRDSTGYLYPDGVYTRTIPSFGSGTDQKINLDKTNNIITLNSPYTGRVVEVGTSVCAAAAGSAYYYPFGGISNSSIQDWTYKSATIPINNNFLIAAKYLKVFIYGARLTCIKLTDTTYLSTLVTDSSGYENNGTIVGKALINTDTPRYKYSLFMNNTGTTNHIESDFLGLNDNIISVSFWVKSAKSTNLVLFAYPEKISIGTLSSLMCVCPTSSTMFNLANFKNNLWNHVVAIRNASSYKLFVNGIEETKSTSSNYYIHNGTKLWLLNRNYNTNYAANAIISDVRIYVTELSESQVKDLYNTSAIIDNTGNISSYQFDESNLGEITKEGISEFNLIELDLKLAFIYQQINPNLLQGTFNGVPKKTRTSSATEFGGTFTPTELLEINTDYTISMLIRGTAPMNIYTLNTGGNVLFQFVNKDLMDSENYVFRSCTFKVTGNRTINSIYICTRYGVTEMGEWFEVLPYSIKLEKGTSATEWIPAITDEMYNNYKNTLSANQFIEI